MSPVIINSSTNWQYLPWIKIQAKVYKLQNSIYQASKECHMKRVHKLQKWIISSSDAKIIAIQKVSRHIVEYYINFDKVKFFLKSNDKWIIYKALFSNCIYDRYIKYIIDKVQEYIIYMCMKPEWEAKLETVHKSSIKNKTEPYFIYRLSRFIIEKNIGYFMYDSNHNLKYQVSIIFKHIDVIFLKNKIQAISYIKNNILRIFNYQNLAEALNNNLYREHNNNLNNCLYEIILSGLAWYNMFNLALQIKFFNLFRQIYITSKVSSRMILLSNSKVVIYSTKYFLSTLGLKYII